MKTKTHRKKTSTKSNTMKMNPQERYGECPDATYHGLHHWFKHLHEQLGWMVLAKHYGMMDKVAVYKHSIQRIQCAIEKKIKHTKDKDRKEDLRIIHHNIMILWEHVKEDFP